jgi:hypothetical protein
MKRIIITISICLFVSHVFSQTLFVESGGLIKVEGSSEIDGVSSSTPTLYIDGDVENNGNINNTGEIQFKGNVNNLGTYTSTGDDAFTGSASQTLNGSFNGGNKFYNLILNKAGSMLNQSGNIKIDEGLYLTNGVLNTASYLALLENSASTALHSIATSGSANNFVQGNLRQDIAPGNYTYYVGDAVHSNQKVSINFANTGGATYIDVTYDNSSAGATSITACSSLYDKQSGTWTLTPNGINGTYDYSVTLDPGGANLSAISPSTWDGIIKDGLFITDPCAQISGNNTVSGLNSFSQFKKASTLVAPLSVSVINFKGYKMATSDMLEWSTSSEVDIAYFNLLYSLDGNTYTTIAKINSKAMNGNSASTLNYNYNHAKPAIGHNYYKLEQVDINGKAKIASQIVDLEWNSNGSTVNMYPNPTKDVLNIDIASSKEANIVLKLLDMSGRIVKQVQARTITGVNNIKISLSELSNGVYSLQVIENNKLTKEE